MAQVSIDSQLLARAYSEHMMNWSDEEIERCFKDCAAADKCIKRMKEIREQKEVN